MKKYRILYLSVLVICTVMLLAYRSKLTTVLFLVAVFLPIVSLLLALVSKAAFKVSIIYRDTIVMKNDPTSITVKLSNRFLMPLSPIGMFCRFPFKPKNNFEYQNILLSVPPFSTITVNFTAPIKLLGTYKSGVEKIAVYDCLKLFCLKKKINRYEDFVILPRKLVIEPILSTEESDTETASQSKFALDKNTFVNVREYQPADSVKHIHWKMSAKLDKMMVKQFERSAGGTAILLADLNGYFPFEEDNYEYADCIIEAMLALDLSLIADKRPCINLWYSSADKRCESFTATDDDSFSVLYDTLSKLPRQTEIFLPEDIAQSVSDIPVDAGEVYFLTSQLRVEFIKRISEIELFNNKKIKVVLIDPPMRSQQQKELAEAISNMRGIELWSINKNDVKGSLNQAIALYNRA